jgi:hypothetical protein
VFVAIEAGVKQHAYPMPVSKKINRPHTRCCDDAAAPMARMTNSTYNSTFKLKNTARNSKNGAPLVV